MKITKKQLKQIIKEELERVLESGDPQLTQASFDAKNKEARAQGQKRGYKLSTYETRLSPNPESSTSDQVDDLRKQLEDLPGDYKLFKNSEETEIRMGDGSTRTVSQGQVFAYVRTNTF